MLRPYCFLHRPHRFLRRQTGFGSERRRSMLRVSCLSQNAYCLPPNPPCASHNLNVAPRQHLNLWINARLTSQRVVVRSLGHDVARINGNARARERAVSTQNRRG